MNSHASALWLCVVAVVLLMASSTVFASPKAVWHCSRHAELNLGDEQSPNPTLPDLFFLSSFSTNAISISLNDLVDIYSGRRVMLGQKALTGCFLAGEVPLNQAAFASIGLRWGTLQLMSRRSAIAQSQLLMVHSEGDMLSCIANNYPAVGYLSSSHNTEQVGPCF